MNNLILKKKKKKKKKNMEYFAKNISQNEFSN